MSMKNASQDLTANPSKDAPSSPERDGRKTAHDDDSREQPNNPPNHGIPTHGVGRFLWEVDKRTPVDELGRLYDRWESDSKQAELGEWSE
jgi:hypothetical protein